MENAAERQDFLMTRAVKHLSEAIQFKTISYPDYEAIDFPVFKEFLAFLDSSYPFISRVCKKEIINEYCPVYIWESESGRGKKPILLLGHYDVVPVAETMSFLLR